VYQEVSTPEADMVAQHAKKLTGISSRAMEHEADRAALSALKQLRGLDELLKMLVGGTLERSVRLLHVASCVKVTPTQFHRVKVLLDRCTEILDWPTPPDAFVTNNPFFNAGVYGVRTPFIVLNSAILRSLSDDELYCVLAHELGHIMCGHSLYKTLLWILVNVSAAALPIPRLLVYALVAALKEWDRKSELSADRAALLALQSETENYSLLMKMAGGDDVAQMNVNDFFEQALEYENQKGIMDSFFKMLNTVWRTHPFPVVRLQELHSWASSGKYKTILDGTYPRRGAEEQTVKEDVKEAYEHYRSGFTDGDDAIRKRVKEAGDSLGKAAKDIGDILRDAFKK
jgi:Zn-dependent protease with chaperone function